MQLALREQVIDCTDHTAVMGIVNVSFDSPVAHSVFEPADARAYALKLRSAGAEIIDIGAQSTRTGAQELSAQEEIERVCPVIEALNVEGILTSVDTWTPAVARAAAQAGVSLLNDVSGFTSREMLAVAAEFHLPAVVMHMRGRPQRHRDVDQTYSHIAVEVESFLLERAAALEAAGSGQVWLDPGFGFAKSPQDNLDLLRALPSLVATGHPVLISASRKGFLAQLLGRGDHQDVDGLLEATVAFNSLAAAAGAHVVRVHDVQEVHDAMRVVDAVRNPSRWQTPP